MHLLWKPAIKFTTALYIVLLIVIKLLIHCTSGYCEKLFPLFTHPSLSLLEGCFKIQPTKQIHTNKVALQKSVLPLSVANYIKCET